MRLYTFVIGLYMSPIQHGIQSGHVVSEMSHQFKSNTKLGKIYKDWAENHKTMIVCSAVTYGGVMRACQAFADFGRELHLPMTWFNEDEESLGGLCTACGIIVPEKYYDAVYEPMSDDYTYVSEGKTHFYFKGTVECEFIRALKSYRLA